MTAGSSREGPPTTPSPVQPLASTLSFGHFSWERFEDLSVEVVDHVWGDEYTDIQRYGGPGHSQDGIDVYGRRGDRYLTAQVRRVQRIGPRDIRTAVEDFLAGRWGGVTERFLVCTKASVRRPMVQDEIERLKDELRQRPIPIAFEVWGCERLERELRDESLIVETYWSPETASAFCPGHRPLFGAANEVWQALRRPPIIDLTDRPEALRRAVADVKRDCAGELVHLDALLGADVPLGLIVAAIQAPDATRAALSGTSWAVLARLAESHGEWPAAVAAWLCATERAPADVVRLMNGVVAAQMTHDDDTAERMLESAAAIDPDHPRVRLSRALKTSDPGRRLALLEEIRSNDSAVDAMVATHRALAHLERDELDDAEACLAAARAADLSLLQLTTVSLALLVQRARRGVQGRCAVPTHELASGERAALRLRQDTLLPQRRVDESCWTLVLAADAAALRFDEARACELLALVEPTEVAEVENRAMVVNAAIRSQSWALVERLLTDAEPIVPIRIARATVGLRHRDRHAQARAELLDLLRADIAADERSDAAVALLVRALERRDGWSDEAEQVLRVEHPIPCVTMKAAFLQRTGHYDEAKALIAPRRSERWARELLFQLADDAHDPARTQLARELLTGDPAPWVRLQCARALYDAGAYEEVCAAAALVRDDDSVPSRLRSEACALLMWALRSLRWWDDAQTVLDRWSSVDPADTRIGAWQALVGNRRAA